MKTTFVSLLLCAAFAGCATPFPGPPDVAHIQLTRGDSPVVVVEKIWLERKNGPLVVKGYVVMRLTADDTTRTHLDVTLFDASETVVRSTVEHFEPRQITRNYRQSDYASYQVILDPLPASTTRIEVRAHEGDHANRS